MPTLWNFITLAIAIIDTFLVPLVFALAFITFLFGIYRGFIAGGANPIKVKEGRQFALWGVIGFAVMVSVWGLVHLLVNSVPLGTLNRPDIPKFDQQSGTHATQSVLSPAATSAGGGSVGSACPVTGCGPGLECIYGNCHPQGDIVAPPAAK